MAVRKQVASMLSYDLVHSLSLEDMY